MASSVERRIASAIIVLVLGCQLFASLAQANRWSWPFTDYPMYAWSHYEGERIKAYPIVSATTEDGQEIEIIADDLGLNIWQFMSWAGQLAAADAPRSDAAPARQSGFPSLRTWIRSTALAEWLKGTDPPQPGQVSPKKASPSLTQIIVSRYEQDYGKRIVRLRVEDNGMIVTKHGMQEVPRKVLAEVDVAAVRQASD